MEVYIGVDVGSVTTKFAVVTGSGELLACNYIRTQGEPVAAVQRGIKDIQGRLTHNEEVRGLCTTGSARYLAGAVLGADIVKNEITAQAVAALHYSSDVQTIIEIGGQDSKLIILRDGMVVDFAMNTICAAGTGSFLDQQALRLNMQVEDFGRRALKSQKQVRIDGRCTVFAESDMIHKQQIGHKADDIICGLCQALVRNYLNDVGKGREILPPVVFQGGVAFNRGIVRALEESLGMEIIIPPHHEAMGAIGAALIACEEITSDSRETKFTGFNAGLASYRSSSFECGICPDRCEVARVFQDGEAIAYWGGRCDIWEESKVG